MLKITSQIKLGNVYICNYQNDEYSYDEIIDRITESDAVINRVFVSSDDSYLNMTVSYDTFLEGKDYIREHTSEQGETSVRLLGEYQQANISITIDPMGMEKIQYTSDNVNVSLKDILGINV